MSNEAPMDITPAPGTVSLDKDTEMSNMTGLQDTASNSTKGPITMGKNDVVARPGIRMRENEGSSHTDPDERPSKRARPLDSLGSLPVVLARSEPATKTATSKGPSTNITPRVPFTSSTTGLTDAQQRHCERVMNDICKLQPAQFFLEPVDPVKAKAPDYLHVIKQPMDLGTIRKRLNVREAQKTGNNASSSSSSLSPYATLQEFVDNVELVFDNCFKYNGLQHPISQGAKDVKSAFEKGMAALPGQSLQFRPVPALPEGALKDRVVSPANQQDAAGQLKRRPSYPPKKFTPAIYARPNRRDPLRIAQEKFCKSVLDHLYRKEYEKLAFAFLQPVDLDAYPDYLDRISKPMDLRTIHDKLSHGAYATPDEFRDDMKTMFLNCYEYNETWTPVCQSGKGLEAVFDEKWKELPLTAPATTPPKKQRSSTTPQKQTRKRTNKPDSQSRFDPLSEEDKVALCEVLVTLADDKMEKVIDLIRERLPKYRENDETLTLEFENIPSEVQSEMYELLKLPKREAKKETKYRPLLSSTITSSSSSSSPSSSSSSDSSDLSSEGP